MITNGLIAFWKFDETNRTASKLDYIQGIELLPIDANGPPFIISGSSGNAIWTQNWLGYTNEVPNPVTFISGSGGTGSYSTDSRLFNNVTSSFTIGLWVNWFWGPNNQAPNLGASNTDTTFRELICYGPTEFVDPYIGPRMRIVLCDRARFDTWPYFNISSHGVYPPFHGAIPPWTGSGFDARDYAGERLGWEVGRKNYQAWGTVDGEGLNGTISTGGWIFLLGYYDAVNQYFALDVGNNLFFREAACSGSVFLGTVTARPYFSCSMLTGSLRVGGKNLTYPGKLAGFPIDNVMLWNRLLTIEEKLLLWNGGNGWSGFIPDMKYNVSGSYLEMEKLITNQSNNNLSQYGILNIKGNVLEDPSIGKKFVFDKQGNITSSMIVERNPS